MINPAELHAFPPLNSCSEQQLDTLAKAVELKSCRAGDTIIGKTADSSKHHYLYSGSVAVKKSFFERSVVNDRHYHRNLEALTPGGSQMIANTDCKIICLPKKLIEEAVKAEKQRPASPSEKPDADDIDWMSQFLESALVHHLEPRTVSKIFSAFIDTHIAPGEAIFNSGDEADAFYIIKNGRAQIKTQSYSGDEGELITLVPGNYFGEEGLIGNTPRNASVGMPNGGVVGRMKREDFIELLKSAMVETCANDALTFGPGSNNVLIDPRLYIEYQNDAKNHSINIPIATLRQKLPQLDTGKTYYISPEGGERSELAAYMMRHAGFETYLLIDQDQSHSNNETM